MRMTDLASPQLAALSRLFSSSVIRELARRGRSPLFARLAKQSQLVASPASECVHTLFDAAFQLLKRQGCRDEYVYKAALVQKILLGRHSLQTASMLNEFRIGGCKADIAILNGTATVYEVKSERDSLARLQRQIAAYMTVFPRVYVITAETHVNAVMTSLPEEIGVLQLNSRHQISTLREAADRPERTSSTAIFDSIRTGEARLILQARGVSIPAVPNTQQSAVLRHLFCKLNAREAHESMVQVLKQTRNLLRLSDLVAQLPDSLHTAALSVPLRKLDHARLVAAVNTPLKDALAWA
ncbi:MAG: uncharacterized protein JWO52_571 [Gammaproteobacteria bacterium]|jgi:hypothetical protein|nr:uncharacterized protein [Gammaproteobacteria bacterium]